jgi:hypothetical protein
LTRITFNLLLLTLGLLTVSSAAAQTRQSVYTNLDDKRCRTLKSDASEAGEYLGRCTGIAGYTLLIQEGDLRQNITVVTPRKAEHSLELWSVVSSAFSSVGDRAEWRVTKLRNKTTPVALIVRYNASEDSENPDKTTSYLVVTKITSKEICVTDRIPPGPKANEDARRLADESATKPCLSEKH